MKKIIIAIIAVWLGQYLSAQSIIQGEYFFDQKKEYGQGTPIDIQNPASSLALDFNVPVDTLQEGLHRLFVRFKDSNGQWGQTLNYHVFIKRNQLVNILAGEYFFDEVGAYGSGHALNLNAQGPLSEVLQDLPTLDTLEGLHRLFVRFKGSNGLWSQTLNFDVFIKHQKLIVIEEGEYFFDTLVGYGNGFPIPIDNFASITTSTGFITAPISLTPGEHTMYYRFKDSEGRWSQTFSVVVCVNVVDGKYTTDTTSYCYDEPVFFNYSGTLTDSAVYDWDLNNNGSFNNLQTNGNSFSHTPQSIATDSAVFRYRISSPLLCGNWQKEDSLKVEVFPEILVDSVVTDVSCFGFDDGEIDLTVTGGVPPFEYAWSNGNNMGNVTALSPGLYDVTVTDIKNCTTSDSFDIDEPDLLVAEVETVVPEMNGDGSGSININVDGGTKPYSFDWQLNGTTISNNEDPMNLSAGNYTLLITDANGCTFSETGIVVDNVVGLFNKEPLEQVALFPNPASTQVNIYNESNASFQLFSSEGRLLKSGTINNVVEKLDLTGLPAGLLILKIQANDKIKIGKFVKTRG